MIVQRVMKREEEESSKADRTKFIIFCGVVLFIIIYLFYGLSLSEGQRWKNVTLF